MGPLVSIYWVPALKCYLLTASCGWDNVVMKEGPSKQREQSGGLDDKWEALEMADWEGVAGEH